MERDYIAVTLHAWGRGKTTKEALAKLRLHASSETLKRQGHIVYSATTETYVNDMGGFNRPEAHPAPVMVEDKRTAYARGGRA